jgi:predicted nucleic acid-binding protein
MSRFVIDPPTLLFAVEGERAIDPAHQLVAPGSIRSQALDLLLARVRDGELGEREALALHERITETKIRTLADRVSRRTAWNLARAHDWETVRDAEYLALVTLQADALVTIDERLAALAAGLVPLVPVDELFVRH